MKRKFKILTLLLSAVIMFSACEEDERLYKKADGNESISLRIIDFDDNQNMPGDVDGEYNIPIYISTVGNAVPADVTIPITIDSTTFDDDFILSVEANAIIEAGSNLGQAYFKVLLDDIPLGVEYDIYYTFGSPSQHEFATNNVSGKLTVIRVCPTSIEGVYDMVAEGVGGGGLGSYSDWTSSLDEVTITKTGELTYTVKPALGGIMVDYYAAFGAELTTAYVTDICGDVFGTVDDGWNESNYTGTVDEGTGVITFSWENPWGDNLVMTLTPQ